MWELATSSIDASVLVGSKPRRIPFSRMLKSSMISYDTLTPATRAPWIIAEQIARRAGTGSSLIARRITRWSRLWGLESEVWDIDSKIHNDSIMKSDSTLQVRLWWWEKIPEGIYFRRYEMQISYEFSPCALSNTLFIIRKSLRDKRRWRTYAIVREGYKRHERAGGIPS